jgi:hypothetical protein
MRARVKGYADGGENRSGSGRGFGFTEQHSVSRENWAGMKKRQTSRKRPSASEAKSPSTSTAGAAPAPNLSDPNSLASDPFMGHWFADLRHGIDYEKCVACGVYHPDFEKSPKLCPNATGPGGTSESAAEDFGPTWAIRPELTPDDIYGDGELPDVLQFETRDQLLQWLDALTYGVANRNRRWYGRIAVRGLEDFKGSPFEGPTFLRYIELGEKLAPWPTLDFKTSIRHAFSGEEPPITCKLGPDWDLERILQASRSRPGHRFLGRQLTNFPDQIARVIDDVQTAFRKRHPQAPVAAECCFLESWDVLRHTAEFCGRVLAPSQEAQILIMGSARDRHYAWRYVEDSRTAVRGQLAVYVAAIRKGEVPLGRPVTTRPVSRQKPASVDFGRRLRNLKKQTPNLTWDTIAAEMRVSRRQLLAIENEGANPTPETRDKVRKYFSRQLGRPVRF